MERLESDAATDGTKLENATKANCPHTRSSTNGQSRNTTRPDTGTLQDATGSCAKRMSREKCSSDCTEVESSSQKVSRQTSEHTLMSFGSDFVQTDSRTKTSQPGGSVPLADARRRPISYNFAGTRHESYGNLGIAGLAGLSSTSATLALLPLQASGQSRTTSLTSPPVTTFSVVTSTPPLPIMVSSSSTASSDMPGVESGEKAGGASTTTVASVKDRRSTFFSEPPKPISLPTRSATQLSSLCDERLDSGSQLPMNISSPDGGDSNGPSLSVMPVPRSGSGSFNSLSTAAAFETLNSPLLSSCQQEHPAVTTKSLLLCRDVSRTVSAHPDISPMPFSDQSAVSVSDSEDTNFSVWCGPPPDAAGAASEPLSVDPSVFETGLFFS